MFYNEHRNMNIQIYQISKIFRRYADINDFAKEFCEENPWGYH